jgi:16S rRNA (cytidine1402-2'-O)-methyltransferase
MKGSLYLLPNLLSDELLPDAFLPKRVGEVILELDGLIVENEKVARKYLSKFKLKMPIQAMPLVVLDEHTPQQDIAALLDPILRGEQWGLLSDAGLPCIADPGHQLVYAAHQKDVSVVALVGPCSIVLALMLSGLPAQNFSFHGYLPREPEERKKRIAALEQEAKREGRTQAFIETPYRNQEMLQDLLSVLQGTTRLAVAWDLTMPTEQVIVRPVSQWKKMELPDIKKKPAIFLFQ